jgi:hypothetical protein
VFFLNSRARGIRGRDQQWQPIEETYRELVERYKKLSLNDFIWILLELGGWAWAKLPPGMHHQMLSPHMVLTKRQKQRMRIQARVAQLASRGFGIDDEVYVGLPALTKASIRREAALRKMRMSPLLREKLGIRA